MHGVVEWCAAGAVAAGAATIAAGDLFAVLPVAVLVSPGVCGGSRVRARGERAPGREPPAIG